MTNLQRAWRYLFAEPFTWIFYAFFQPNHFDKEIGSQNQAFRQRATFILRLIMPMFFIIYALAFVGRIILIESRLVHMDVGTALLDLAIGSIIGIIGGAAYGILVYSGDTIEVSISVGVVFGISFTVMSGVVFGMAVGTALCIGLGIAYGIWQPKKGVIEEIEEGILSFIVIGAPGLIFAFGIVPGIAGSIAWGIIFGISLGGGKNSGRNDFIASILLIGILAGVIGGVTGGIIFHLAGGIASAIASALSVAIGYTIGYFRLPLYLVSGPSTRKAFRASHNNHQRVFDYLHRSSLYWDECVYLPLPFLKDTLLIAYGESSKKALEEISFITAKRPQQMRAARAAILEIAVGDLEKRKKLEQIAAAADRLAELLPPETKLADPRWANPLARLGDASRDAMRASSPIGLQGRRKALDHMQANLRKVHHETPFRDPRLNERLVQVVETWQAAAQEAQELLNKAAQDVGNLDDPYKPGQVLSLKDSLFVGRRGLAKELEGALSLESRRPAFLLNGERRMGKTSALQQLPNLLGSSYISVFYNLQQPGLYASTPVFLGTLAEGIYREMNARAIPVEPFVYSEIRRLSDSSAFNYSGRPSDPAAYKSVSWSSDPSAYKYFERWLAQVEETLEQENRTLLLAFDEFEELEEAEQAEYMDVRLLLNWMRNIIQFHPRIALLFSGVKTFDEMGRRADLDWTSYFINVQILRLSLLKSDEARQLILEPTSDFPGERLFPPAVVELIIAETGCHPFLVQAVCSGLITLLNVDRREQATIDDVGQVVEKVLDDWGSHFANLWNRTDDEQRACLEALLVKQCVDKQWLAQHTNLDEKTIRRVLQKLVRRDLVLRDKDELYSIAVPMFRRWLERNG